MSAALTLVAFPAAGSEQVPIVPAPRWREWMNATNARSANRCLPLLMANEAGWVLLNPETFTATWDGHDHPHGVRLDWDNRTPREPTPISSHFGSGVITWNVPYLFRTPPGWNLLARGPANWPRDGVCALEGLVETDWAVSTFTMNWKLTRPGQPVRFERGEPFCMVVPQRRGELESFSAAVEPLPTESETYQQAKRWAAGRHQAHVRKFLAEFSKDFEADWDAWERHYFRGVLPDGSPAPEHQTKLRLAEFGGTTAGQDDERMREP